MPSMSGQLKESQILGILIIFLFDRRIWNMAVYGSLWQSMAVYGSPLILTTQN
jgi:hypothetical protein